MTRLVLAGVIGIALTTAACAGGGTGAGSTTQPSPTTGGSTSGGGTTGGQTVTGTAYYPLAVGKRWQYAIAVSGPFPASGDGDAQVTALSGQTFTVVSTIRIAGQTSSTTTQQTVNADGTVTISDGTITVPPDSAQPTETVTVPAGTFQAVKTARKNVQAPTSDWFVRNIGIVRTESTASSPAGSTTTVAALTAYQ